MSALNRRNETGLIVLFGIVACASSDLVRTQRDALADCIASGTEADINAALVGKEAEAVLCPGALFTLSNPVVFTAPNQRIYTQGFQTGASRAILRIGAGTLTKAIDGNNQSGIAIQYIEVDGNRVSWATSPARR